ncbi:MAG: 4-(cytidine 5'-diphospho)-2-C-methyl-D-erythritol kinase [Verrucomicrobia bacterium]|nr:4-(cytidine 5'-diphospho)-2-C-methyl-D-erythritol kinase [Verrucomicrobiota bacterium]
MAFELASPCKVNLLLNILGKRPDGFHELETVLYPVDLHDRLSFERGPSRIELTCNHPALPVDASNLVHRAAEAFLRAAGVPAGVRIHLDKRLPLAAGLGAGSGNAAATLLGLNRLFDQPLSAQQLANLAVGLGSDVPFFLQSKPALGTGRGEQIRVLDWFPALRGAWLLLLHPGFGVSTAWAYRNLARYPDAVNGRPGRAAELLARLQRGDLEAAGAAFYNALETPVLEKYPLLALYQEFLCEHGAVVARMSGSGSTTFALSKSRAEAEALQAACDEAFGTNLWSRVVPLTETAREDGPG